MAAENLIDHARSPRNVGEMAWADAFAEDENPVCGDRLRVWLRVRDGRIELMTWKADGCAPALAAASITSELVQGRSLQEARHLDREAIAAALGGLPARKSHAALLAASTLRKALQAYDSALHHA